MHLKTLPLAAAALLLAGSYAPVAARATTTVAQMAAPGAVPLTREQNDARMTSCAHYRNAFHQLDDVKREVAQLQNDFLATDDIRPKLDALITQTNDAQMTARVRAEGCPGRHK